MVAYAEIWILRLTGILPTLRNCIECDQALARPLRFDARRQGFVCEGCAAFIQDSLKGFAGIENLKVDQKAKMVRFSVKKDAVVKVADLQKALKSASDEMGMGADYSLSELRKS